MAIGVSAVILSYRPFACTKDLYRWQSRNVCNRDWREIARSVAVVAVTLLATVPAVILDLILCAVSLTYRFCNRSSQRYIGSFLPRARAGGSASDQPPPTSDAVVVLGAAPPAAIQISPLVDSDKTSVDRVLANPYPGTLPANNVEFLTTAIHAGLDRNSDETAGNYLLLIRDEGVAADGQEPPGGIFQWCAGCLLTQYLLALSHYLAVANLYPGTHDGMKEPSQSGRGAEKRRQEISEHYKDVWETLSPDFSRLTREEQASVILKITVPSREWELTDSSRDLVNRINTRALAMSQDRSFLHYVYKPVADDIANI